MRPMTRIKELFILLVNSRRAADPAGTRPVFGRWHGRFS
jgi:hypothetical protein